MAEMIDVSTARTVAYAALIALTVYTVIDLDHPRSGLINIDAADQPFIELRDLIKQRALLPAVALETQARRTVRVVPVSAGPVAMCGAPLPVFSKGELAGVVSMGLASGVIADQAFKVDQLMTYMVIRAMYMLTSNILETLHLTVRCQGVRQRRARSPLAACEGFPRQSVNPNTT